MGFQTLKLSRWPYEVKTAQNNSTEGGATFCTFRQVQSSVAELGTEHLSPGLGRSLLRVNRDAQGRPTRVGEIEIGKGAAVRGKGGHTPT